MSNTFKLIHPHSVVVTEGNPKLPTSDRIEYGEIAINYAKDYETMSIKNNYNDIVTFSSDKKILGIISEDEKVVSSALNDLNERIEKNDENLTQLSEEIEERMEETIDKMISITYSSLKNLRDNSQLKPGQFYRITDYQTTTVQLNTQSANHPFDVIVLATDVNVLNENAKAIKHDGDTYFNNVNFNVWEIKYCIDNDTNRFAWADTNNGKGVIYYMRDEWNNECGYDFKNIQFKRWAVSEITSVVLNSAEISDMENQFIFDNTNSKFQTRFSPSSSNIKFNNLTNVLTFVVDSNNSDFYYTFSTNLYDSSTYVLSTIEDASIKGNHVLGEYDNAGCYNNVIKPYINNVGSYLGGIDGSQYLNNIVFNGCYETNFANAEHCYCNFIDGHCYDMTFGYRVHHNKFDINCALNIFGNTCYYNNFGKYCFYNLFSHNCYNNTLKNGCWYDVFSYNCCDNVLGYENLRCTFGYECQSNLFGSYSSKNTLGNGSKYNVIGSDSSENTFGSSCKNNVIGNDCDRNTLGNNSIDNTFGNGCNDNTLGLACHNNVFRNNVFFTTLGQLCDNNVLGNSCGNINFGNECCHNTIGENCKSIVFDKASTKYYYNIVQNGNQSITLTSNFTGTIQNIEIAQGVNNSNTPITITHDTANSTNPTTYKNSNSTVVTI